MPITAVLHPMHSISASLLPLDPPGNLQRISV